MPHLYSFAVLGTPTQSLVTGCPQTEWLPPFINVMTRPITTNKADSLDGRMITNSVDSWDSPMYDAQNTRR